MYFLLHILLVIVSISFGASPTATLKMATTTSTDNSGLLTYLLPAFEKETGIKVQIIAVGTGKALKHGENGDVDVVLVHAKKAENEFVNNGFGVDRRDVMYNDFVITGPLTDPAGLSGVKNVTEAFSAIIKSESPFISRGDESGTHKKEQEIWDAAGIKPEGKWYLQAGQGMEAVLMMASEKQAYTLTDRATFIAMEDNIELKLLLDGSDGLFNQYGIIAVNPEKHKHAKYEQSVQLIEWLCSEDGQRVIGSYKLKGKQLFFPNAK